MVFHDKTRWQQMQIPNTAAGFGTLTSKVEGFFHFLRRGMSAHGIFWVVVGGYYAAYLLVHYFHPELVPIHVLRGSLIVFWLSLPLLFFSIVAMRFYHVVRFDRPERPTIAVLKDIGQFLVNPRRMANALPMLFIMVIFAFIFADVQGKILTLNPSVWDATFADFDKLLHFGRQPWEWLQPILGFPRVTFLINLNYNIWFFVMWMNFVYFGFAERPSELRTQFFLSFIATWIIGGTILATIFSSGGPCYYTRLGLSPDPYADLMTYLRATNTVVPVWAIEIQDVLWNGHLRQAELSEVSAMPSMHNASTLLFVLASFRLSRFWGWILTTHAALIFIGSIHLAWHYAVDSYVSWALVIVIWYAMAPVARWWHGTSAQKKFDGILAT
jgi:hypothetical protein